MTYLFKYIPEPPGQKILIPRPEASLNENNSENANLQDDFFFYIPQNTQSG